MFDVLASCDTTRAGYDDAIVLVFLFLKLWVLIFQSHLSFRINLKQIKRRIISTSTSNFAGEGGASADSIVWFEMSTKVKGLLRGLRYISQIFDEKEEEMQIGFPTDVKHVAHIGWDGQSANAPSWMNEFKSPPELSNGPSSSVEEVKDLSTNPPLEDTTQTEKPKHRSRRSSRSASSLMSSPDRRSIDTTKHSRRPSSGSAGSPSSSPRGSDAPKHSRRHRSSSKSADSQREESSGSSRTSRRHKTSSSLGAESSSQDQPSIPKHSRVRKSKGSSKSKEKSSSAENIPFSDSGSGRSESVQGRKNTASQLSSVLEAYEEEG